MMETRVARRRPRGGGDDDGGARERLLAAAAALFAEKGYAAASVGEIVAAAGITRPVLYYWFRSKEGIYLALLQEAFVVFERLLDEAARAPGGTIERLRRLCDGTLALMATNMAIVRIMHAAYYGPPQGAPRFDFDVFHTRFREAVFALVAAGARRGELRSRDQESQAWAVIGALNVCIELQLCHPELVFDPRALFRRIFDTTLRGIAAPRRKETRR